MQTKQRKRNRLKIYERDNYTCQYCGLNMKDNYEKFLRGEIHHSEQLITIDHIKPRPVRIVPAWIASTNRDWSPENLVTACKDCNNKKGNLTQEEFMASLIY